MPDSAHIPVVLFHQSEQIHVLVALYAASLYNKQVTIITDGKYDSYRKHATMELAGQYRGAGATELSRVYKHLSTTNENFEFVCIERWFIILEYMKRHGYEEIFYIDSDVVTHSDYTSAIRNNYAACDYCLCIPEQDHHSFNWLASGHFSYWTREALEKFCAFVIGLYTQHLDVLESKWHWHQANGQPGGICDMTLLYLFQRESTLRCGNLLKATPDNTTFDIGVNIGSNEYPDEYQTAYSRFQHGIIKQIRFRDKMPYAIHLKDQREIRMHGLHFQADSKKLMPFYIRRTRNLEDMGYLIKWRASSFYLRLRLLLNQE